MAYACMQVPLLADTIGRVTQEADYDGITSKQDCPDALFGRLDVLPTCLRNSKRSGSAHRPTQSQP
jgi:hypothetical protein